MTQMRRILRSVCRPMSLSYSTAHFESNQPYFSSVVPTVVEQTPKYDRL